MEGSRLARQARQTAGLTQAELARRLGKSQPAIAALERPGANPRLSTLEQVMRATGHSLELRAGGRTGGDGVDATLLARNLRLRPDQRLAQFESWLRDVRAMRQAAGRSRG